MKMQGKITLLITFLSIIAIVGCTPDNQITETPTNTEEIVIDSDNNQEKNSSDINNGHPPVSQGGQVLEVGKYHLELVTLAETNGAHLDFYLQTGDNHENIPDAEVVADIQFPDGTQKQFNFDYDAQGEHYTFDLQNVPKGQYQMRVTANVNGEVVNGRFSFNL